MKNGTFYKSNTILHLQVELDPLVALEDADQLDPLDHLDSASAIVDHLGPLEVLADLEVLDLLECLDSPVDLEQWEGLVDRARRVIVDFLADPEDLDSREILVS